MLKIVQLVKENRIPVTPINGIYNVLELGRYEITFTSGESILSASVFIEDIPIETSKTIIEHNTIKLIDFRYFEDYFGYATLRINNEVFHLNIRIEKLKLSEIEDIFTFLWTKEEKLFNIFFSKSTYELDFKSKGFELGNTSKLISFVDMFISVFDKLYFSFFNMPHTVLRKYEQKTSYTPKKVTSDTIDWILNNLDEVSFDDSFKGHFNSIALKNKYGIIDKINTVENENSCDTYENQIILGAFKVVLRKLAQLKNEISSNINLKIESDTLYADFKDLKKIPFIKLFKESASLEKRISRLFVRYKKLFHGVLPRTDKPVLTGVFAQKNHYKKAFTLIKNLNDFKFDLFGEFKLLNISKLSRLYEVYNLYIIIDTLKSKLRLDTFTVNATSTRNDEIVEKISFKKDNYVVNFYYEHKFFTLSYKNQITNLRRIDASNNGNYYNPDYIIEIINSKEEKHKYYVMDSKYSKFFTVRNTHVRDVMEKYVMNTGIANNPNGKINSLCLIFPGEIGQDIISSNYFEPTVKLLASKPLYEKELIEFVSKVLASNLPKELILD